jgi:hypothetical protein
LNQLALPIANKNACLLSTFDFGLIDGEIALLAPTPGQAA